MSVFIPNMNILNIKQKSGIKYFGIYLDEFLSWKNQITYINNKITKNLCILYKLRNYLGLQMLSQLYYTLVFPYLNYGAMSWGNTHPTNLMKLKTKQNKCFRSIFLLIAENLLSHITKYLIY